MPSLAKLITLRVMSVSRKLEDSRNLQLEIDVVRRLRLAAITHIYLTYPCLTDIAACSLVQPCRRDSHLVPETGCGLNTDP